MKVHNICSPSRKNLDFLILDDYFPSLLSAFRIAEYNSYLTRWENGEARTTYGNAPNKVFNREEKFLETLKDYEEIFPQFKGRVKFYNKYENISSKIGYTVFIINAYKYLKFFEKNKIPFFFTLYPGGGFRINDKQSDDMLKRVCSSKYFKKVIVTQKISYEYLLDKGICNSGQISFIYGGVVPSKRLIGGMQSENKLYYPMDKDTFDICFVANKYMSLGLDKGYDTFINVAHQVIQTCPNVRFHVVGGFSAKDIDIQDIAHRIKFYGMQKTEFFPSFYLNMDVIISPNVPFVVLPGSFDGFPLGCSVEAALCGVAVFCTDPLSQNIHFTNGKDIVIISTDIQDIIKKITYYYNTPDKLYDISKLGKEKFSEVFDEEIQSQVRIQLFDNFLKEN